MPEENCPKISIQGHFHLLKCKKFFLKWTRNAKYKLFLDPMNCLKKAAPATMETRETLNNHKIINYSRS